MSYGYLSHAMTPANDPDPVSSLTPVGDPIRPSSGGADRETLAQIRRRSSPITKLVAIALVVLVGSVSVFMLVSYRQGQAEEQLVNEAGHFPDGSPEMLAALRAAWPELTARDQQLRVVRNLFHYDDREAGSIYLEALDAGGGIRRFAALGLVQLGADVPAGTVAKLESLLPETDPRIDRTAVTWAIAALGGSAPDAILEDFAQGNYQEDDDIEGQFDPSIIARALGPERLRSRALITHEEKAVRLLTAQALSELGGAESVGPLNELLQNELAIADGKQSREVIEVAASGLGRTGDASAVDILAAVVSQHPDLRKSVHEQLRRTAGAPKLALLLKRAATEEDREALLGLLVESHDPGVADTLAALLDDESETIRQQAALGLSEFGDERAAGPLVTMVNGADRDVVEKALEGLVRVASPAAASGLLRTIPASCPNIPEPGSPPLCFQRAGVIRALGASGGTAAARRIQSDLGSSDGQVAAVALAQLNYSPVYGKLLKQAERPRSMNMHAETDLDRRQDQEDTLFARRAAISALGHFRRRDAANTLMAIVEDDAEEDFELRSLAAQSLGMLASEEILREITTRIQDVNQPDSTRIHYGIALWQTPLASLKTEYLNIIGSRAPAGAKRGAAMAYGRIISPSDEGTLVDLMQDDSSRTAAAIATLLGGTPLAAKELLKWVGTDRNLTEDLELVVKPDSGTAFSRLTVAAFESGHVWNQLLVAKTLATGTEAARFSNAWHGLVEVLNTGSDGIDGVHANESRFRLFEALTSDDAGRRELAAQALRAGNEFGLLLRARDEGGAGATEARAALLGR